MLKIIFLIFLYTQVVYADLITEVISNQVNIQSKSSNSFEENTSFETNLKKIEEPLINLHIDELFETYNNSNKNLLVLENIWNDYKLIPMQSWQESWNKHCSYDDVNFLPNVPNIHQSIDNLDNCLFLKIYYPFVLSIQKQNTGNIPTFHNNYYQSLNYLADYVHESCKSDVQLEYYAKVFKNYSFAVEDNYYKENLEKIKEYNKGIFFPNKQCESNAKHFTEYFYNTVDFVKFLYSINMEINKLKIYQKEIDFEQNKKNLLNNLIVASKDFTFFEWIVILLSLLIGSFCSVIGWRIWPLTISTFSYLSQSYLTSLLQTVGLSIIFFVIGFFFTVCFFGHFFNAFGLIGFLN